MADDNIEYEADDLYSDEIEIDGFDIEGTGNTRTYQTKEVAEMLNEDPQTIRNICLQFEKFMKDFKKTRGGRRHFTNENIEELKKIINMRNKGMSSQEITDYLCSIDGVLELIPDGAGEGEALARLYKIIQPQIKEIIDESISTHFEKYIESKNDNVQELIKGLQESNVELKESNVLLINTVNELKEQIEKDKEENSKKRKKIFGIF